ncbi:uncharacterized protein LOC125223425 [Salvia hispanica]|uniref:uncharacterized protein LOC125223425 n=1 Tax=Salvia hispanica TaxID=49212 RepID=UPI002009C889|nr:uncharacterized protein LOC125223425 [Salvia hispanica]
MKPDRSHLKSAKNLYPGRKTAPGRDSGPCRNVGPGQNTGPGFPPFLGGFPYPGFPWYHDNPSYLCDHPYFGFPPYLWNVYVDIGRLKSQPAQRPIQLPMGLPNGMAPASESEAQLRLASEVGVIADVAHAMLYRMLCEYHKLFIAETDEEMKNMLRDIIKELKFKYWDIYVVLMGSTKFRAGAANWPKLTRLDIPIGKKLAMRMSRGGAIGSHEVQLATPSVEPSHALINLTCLLQQIIMFEAIQKWKTTDDPLYKEMLEDVIQIMRRNLMLPPLTGSVVVDSDAAGTGQGDSDE